MGEFNFIEYDEVELGALDSTLSLHFEETFPEMERAKINSKMGKSDDGFDAVETWVLVHLKQTDWPFTYMTGRIKENSNAKKTN